MAGKKIVRKKSVPKRRVVRRHRSTFFIDKFTSLDHEVVFSGFLLAVSLLALGFSVRIWDWGFEVVRAAGQ